MSFTGIFHYIRNQLTALPDATADLTGKTVIITGANVGLGYETAKKMAGMNPGLLILACRSVDKGQVAMESIKKETGCQNMEVMQIDHASFESVKTFATEFTSKGVSLDIFIANAGISPAHYETTGDGWHDTLQVNYLSTVLLMFLLLPTFSKKISPDELNPRAVIIVSDAHHLVYGIPEAESPSIFNALNEPSRAAVTATEGSIYSMTKLFEVLFVRRLAKLLSPDSPLTISAVNPGLCSTTITGKRGAAYFVDWLFVGIALRWLGRTPEQGSRTYVDGAIGADKGKPAHGRYLSTCKIVEESPYAKSQKGRELEEKLWNESVELLTGIDSRVGDIVKTHLI